MLSNSAYLLTTLSNPLNLSLLTTQLLSAPAIWERVNGLRTCLRVMGVFQSAAINILRQEDEAAAARKQTDWKKELAISNLQRATTLLSRQEWVTAVIKGANDRSPRWKHLLVLGGLLVGFEGQERQGMSRHLRSTVESAFVKAMNLALDDVGMGEDLGAQSIALTLNWNFDLLSPLQRSMMDHDVSD